MAILNKTKKRLHRFSGKYILVRNIERVFKLTHHPAFLGLKEGFLKTSKPPLQLILAKFPNFSERPL